MIHEGRKPRDRGERMILNKYQTMQHILDVKDDELTPKLVREIHQMVTDGTLPEADSAGRLRRPNQSPSLLAVLFKSRRQECEDQAVIGTVGGALLDKEIHGDQFVDVPRECLVALARILLGDAGIRASVSSVVWDRFSIDGDQAILAPAAFRRSRTNAFASGVKSANGSVTN